MAKTRWARDYTRDIIDAKKLFDDAKEHVGDPPDGQVPLNDWGIYTSPNLQNNKPVSPFDCDNYPDSPYCGGNPWTRTPVGLEPEWGFNECGVWVQLNPVLGFTKLPPVSVGWRRPGKCREEEKPPPPPPTLEDDGRSVDPLKFPKYVDPNIPVFVVIGRTYKYVYTFDGGWGQFGDQWVKVGNEKSTKLIDIHGLNDTEYPVINTMVPPYYPTPNPVLAVGIADLSYQQAKFYSGYEGVEDSISSGTSRGWIASDQKPPWRQYPNNKRYLYRDGELRGNYLITGFLGGDAYEAGSFILYGTLNEIKKDWEGWVSDFKSASFTDKKELASSYVYKAEWKVLYISIPDPDKYPPPPDQRRKKDCCMQCCSGGNQAANKQNQDLTELLRLVRKLDKKMGEYPFNVVLFDTNDEKVGAQKKTVSVADVAKGQKLIVEREEKNAKSIGIDQFPIYAPSSNVKDESNGLIGDLGDLKNKIFKQKIESIAELLSWKIKQDHEVFGQWQEYIEIQDSDPNVKGNQPKRVVLPNMARSFRELVLLNSIQIKSTGMLLDSVLKMYVDVAGTKVLAAQIKAVIEDVQDFLDYPTTEKYLNVPMGITIPDKNDDPDDKEDIKRFLSNSTIKAKFDDWTGEGSIHDMLVVLLEAASMIKAAFYERS